ncbi:hypothetical protein CPB84DRAFT_1790885 [Gymnopilus junonius]|uniref:Uncharacterized protein n=1 Tax=Gymnopilus junonius TaxID=109634 RepID=A0A9P5THS0_GYMJU|nr:hypothetical protein CPB84DRAFT_1790885 [Gymnopilus junonius]
MAPQPAPTARQPQVIRVPPTTSSPPRHGNTSTSVRPVVIHIPSAPSPPQRPPAVVVTQRSVPHPTPPSILRMGSGPSPPRVTVASPIQIQETPPLPSAHAPGQPARQRPWIWPEPREPEMDIRKTRSGQPRKGSQNTAPRPNDPPPVRPPRQERRQSSSFVANDPFKFLPPRRRKREEQVQDDEEPLNFDSITIPASTESSSSSSAGETLVSPVIPGLMHMFGSYDSSESSSGSKGSSEQSMLSIKTIAQITNYVIPVVPFIFTTLIGQAYVYILFQADLTVGDLKHMALEAGSKDRKRTMGGYELESAKETPQYERLKTTWGDFIDSVMREWKTFNVISVLLLS